QSLQSGSLDFERPQRRLKTGIDCVIIHCSVFRPYLVWATAPFGICPCVGNKPWQSNFKLAHGDLVLLAFHTFLNHSLTAFVYA
ncbi:MAG: hypothetical protein AAGF25_15385, partial [Pseudomonadota bacterium]